MKIKKYEAPTLREAMERAKQELGEEAVILNTREVKPAGGNGPLFKPTIELVAAVDETLQRMTGQAAEPGPRKVGTPEKSGEQIASEVAALRSAFESLVGEGVLLAHVNAAPGPEKKLRDAGVDASLAAQITKSIRQPSNRDDLVRQWSCMFICQPFRMPDIGPAIIALIGPTGSGKTTTIAKLAAHYRFTQQKSVAVLGCDSSRIGASAQLETLAKALGVIHRPCFDRADVSKALDELASNNIILIDTPGGSARDQEFFASLTGLLSDARIQTHLCIPANMSPDARQLIFKTYSALNYQSVVVTKVDETPNAAPLLAICQLQKAGVSFVCDGQQVTGSLIEATPEGLASLVLKDLAA